MSLSVTSLGSLARTALRPAFNAMRAEPVYAEARWLRGQGGDRIAFLPAYGPEGAALLRIYRVADALRPLGWNPLILSPWMSLAQRRRALDAFQPDLLVMQGVRHALNRPELYATWPIVFDMDDADFHIKHLEVHVRQAMGHVAAVMAGSTYIANWCLDTGAPAAHVVWTGSEVSDRPRAHAAMRGPVIAWAQTRPMTYLNETSFVADVMRRLITIRPGLTLRLYDRRESDDPAFPAQFNIPGLLVEWRGRMAYDEYLSSFDDVAIGLAPLCPETPFVKGKSFGKVLAYLDAHVPVIASQACEHVQFFTPQTGVVTNDPSIWVSEISRLLEAPEIRQAMAEAAFDAFRARLGIGSAAASVDRVLRSVLASGASRGNLKGRATAR